MTTTKQSGGLPERHKAHLSRMQKMQKMYSSRVCRKCACGRGFAPDHTGEHTTLPQSPYSAGEGCPFPDHTPLRIDLRAGARVCPHYTISAYATAKVHHMITMHAHPRQTDGQTDARTSWQLAQRFVS